MKAINCTPVFRAVATTIIGIGVSSAEGLINTGPVHANPRSHDQNSIPRLPASDGHVRARGQSQTSRLLRLTFDPEIDHGAVWSPDGAFLVFDSHRNGPGDLYSKASSGNGAETLLLRSSVSAGATDWTRDGRFILFTSKMSRS